MYKNEKIFQFFANLILALLTICCVAPFLLMISASFSSESALSVYGYTFWPKEFDLSAYKYLFSSTGALLKAYSVSIGVTVVGTVLNLIMTILMSYPLSRKDLPGRNIFAFYLFFTMLFNGGLIPSYIMWTRNFHIQNTIWALLIPNLLLNAYNVIMMRTYFTSSIPMEIIEAAKIDGATKLQRIWHVTLPGILPIIAINFVLRMGSVLDAGFEQIFIMYSPYIKENADILGTYTYRLIREAGLLPQYALSTAVGLFNGVVSMVLVLLTNWFAKKYLKTGLW